MEKSDPLPPIAVLAGGQATRLWPLTATIPKSMIEVAGEPFISHQLRLLVRQGIKKIVLCCGIMGEQIEDFVGAGAAYGCRIRYSWDGEKPLGTGGALRRALPMLGDRFLVTYGDSYLTTQFRPVYEGFVRAGRPALMTVFRNEGRWDTSNIEFSDGEIRCYDKVNRTPRMHYIDYGLSVLESGAIAGWRADDVFDLADVFRDLLQKRALAGYEVRERFFEIGSPSGLAEANAFLAPNKSESACAHRNSS
jgi:NDP-sugar pyrophosphorylase family protein